MSRRKVITEITIETTQVLVIMRTQVNRSGCSECGSQAESARREDVKARVDETGSLRGLEALSGSPYFSQSADGFHLVDRRSLLGATTLGATTLAKRFINCLRRGSKRKNETQE